MDSALIPLGVIGVVAAFTALAPHVLAAMEARSRRSRRVRREAERERRLDQILNSVPSLRRPPDYWERRSRTTLREDL